MSEPSFEQIYSQQIKELRNRLRSVDLRDLEAVTRVSRATLFRVRQGRHDPTPKTIDAVWAGIRQLEEAEREGSD